MKIGKILHIVWLIIQSQFKFNYLHFILELYIRNRYFIGTNTINTRRIGRKIVKKKFITKAIYRGGGQFFIKNFCITYNPNYIGDK